MELNVFFRLLLACNEFCQIIPFFSIALQLGGKPKCHHLQFISLSNNYLVQKKSHPPVRKKYFIINSSLQLGFNFYSFLAFNHFWDPK